MSDARLVVIARFNDPITAQTARIALDHEGIDCALMDENQAAYPIGALIPVRLAVREEDEQDARAILVEQGLL